MNVNVAKKLLALKTSTGDGWSILFGNVMINDMAFQPEDSYAVGEEGQFFGPHAYASTPEEAIINFLTNDKRYGKLFK